MIEKLGLPAKTELKLRIILKWLPMPPFSCEFNRFLIIKECCKEIDRLFEK